MRPPVAFTDLTHISLCPDDQQSPASPCGSGDHASANPRRDSRANSVKLGLRSKLLFPLEMMESISEIASDFSRQLKPVTSLDKWLVFELARSCVQADKASDQILLDDLRVIERVGTSFDDDASERIDRLGSRLARDPYNVQRALSRSKHGALYSIERLSWLDDAVQTNGGLDEEQRQRMFDLLGIEHVYRNGSRKVPAGMDVEGLRALIDREIKRYRSSLKQTLNARSELEKEMAQLGIMKVRDSETRALRSDLNRARRRFSWALETLQRLQAGADPATITDPDTGKPVAAGPPAAAVAAVMPTSSPAAPAAAPAPATPEREAAAEQPGVPPIPAGCTDEDKTMWLVAAGAILSKSATPPSDEPGSLA
jgi:hypothetical protein